MVNAMKTELFNTATPTPTTTTTTINAATAAAMFSICSTVVG